MQKWMRSSAASLTPTPACGYESIHTQNDSIDTDCETKTVPRHSWRISPSNLGDKCARKLWYKFRWTALEKIGGRQSRLFRRGHGEEEKVIALLRATGWEVIEKDPSREGQEIQQYRVKDFEGHLSGWLDGVCRHPVHTNNEWWLLEIKTYNDKRFNELVKKTVVLSDPKYYTQCAIYMMKRDLAATLFFAVNKNDDDIHCEVIARNDEEATVNLQRAHHIIASTTPPPRISDNSAYFECKFCPMLGVCHQGKPYEKNCRSCVNGAPGLKGEWFCTLYQQTVPVDFVPKGCDQYREAR